MCEPGKSSLQWIDGMGNIEVCNEPGHGGPGDASPGEQTRNVQRFVSLPSFNLLPLLPSLVEVDAGWALGVAGLAILIIFALCVIAKCNLSVFTRCAGFYDPGDLF
jgi:hypothetical protein